MSAHPRTEQAHRRTASRREEPPSTLPKSMTAPHTHRHDLSECPMNLRDLAYLVSLAEHRHFGRAAEASFVSQPTLSTQIKKLEDELGVALVERTPRKVLLTETGREIARRARGVLAE